MKKHVVLISLFCATVGYSQQRDTTCERLGQEAYDKARARDYKRAIVLLQEALQYCNSNPWMKSVHYNLACFYSHLDDSGKTFQYLDRAIREGFTNYNTIAGDPDFEQVKNKFPDRFHALISEAKTAYDKARIEQSPIAITSFDNYVGPAAVSDYAWDNFHDPNMDTLRQKYQLSKIVESGNTEFDKMKLLLAWTSTRFTHHSSNFCKGGNALAILAEAEKGAQFSCSDYSRLLANCLDALGYPARTIGLTWLGSGFGNPDAHVCTETWSNQFQKWILLDGQNNAWWEHDGVPLNAVECRNLYANGRDSEIVFVGQQKDIDYTQAKAYWISHFYHLELGNYYAFFDTKQLSKRRYFQLVTDGVMPELFSRGMPDSPPLSNDEQNAYPMLNQTNISLQHMNERTPSDTLEIRLRHTMPWFATFMVRINGSDWKQSNDTLVWILKPGENSVEAKAFSLAGIEGRARKIVLRNNILKKP
jgi:hypothetical protein